MAKCVVEKVLNALLAMQRYQWEQGVAAQAMLELGESDLVILMAKEAVVRQAEDGRLGVMGENRSVTDPACNGEPVLYAAKVTDILNASLGGGRTILPLARVNSYIGLWSVPEPVTSGVLQLNSICGLNMYGAIISNYLNEYDIPFKWFYGYTDNPLFLERFKITLKAMKAIKSLKNSRIGLIGDIADGFENFNFDERKLEKKFGSYIYRRHTEDDIVRIAESYDENKVKQMLDKIISEGDWQKDRVDETAMKKFARINMAFEDFAKENDYNALAITCWPKFQQIYDIAVCGALSRLNESGIVATCEGDVPGALNMLIFNAMTGERSTMTDLSAIDENDNSICMWHCGPTARSFANRNGVKWDAHFNIGCYCDGNWCGKGVVADLRFKPGKVTITRINSDGDKIFVMMGEVMADKDAFEGSSGWINNLAIGDRKLNIPDYINTLITNRIDHHHQIAYGDLTNEMVEFSGWMNMEVMDAVPYKPYVQGLKK